MEDALGTDLLDYKCPLIIRDKPPKKEELEVKKTLATYNM